MGTLIRFEIRRVLRDPGFLIFAVGLPVVLFLVFSAVFGNLRADGVDTTAYLMISMATYGAMSVAINTTGLVANERRIGWNRQLRLTPLPGWAFVASKAAVSLVVALPALALVLVAGFATGVSLPLDQWLLVLLVVWLGVLPFVAIGLLIGMVVSPEAHAGVSTAVGLGLAVLGGLFVPTEVLPAGMQAVAQGLPSYWVAAAARAQIGGEAAVAVGVGVCAAWLLLVGALVVQSYRRDTVRI